MPRTRLAATCGPRPPAPGGPRPRRRRYRARVLVCMTGCRSLGADRAGRGVPQRGRRRPGLQDEVAVVDVGCHGQCALAPAVVIEPQDYLYGGVKPEDVGEIIETTLRGGKPVERLCQRVDGRAGRHRRARRPSTAASAATCWPTAGGVDPKRIEDADRARHLRGDGEGARPRCSPRRSSTRCATSGLRGRGGAGFPTGVKWGLCRKAPGERNT